MSTSTFQLACLRDPRLSAHAVDEVPAWLWSQDGTRLLWSNAVGAAIFGAEAPAALSQHVFAADDVAAQQIARIAATLPAGGEARLERMRGFGGAIGRPLTCTCSRLRLADVGEGIFVVAVEPAGPALPLAERVRRLLAGMDIPLAVFSPDGRLFHAAGPALQRLATTATLSSLDADALAAHALHAGYASGPTKLGEVSVERIGRDATTFLVASLQGAAAPAAQSPVAAPSAEAAPMTAAPSISEQMEADADVFSAAEGKTPATPQAPPAQDGRRDIERRYPLRFVWHMDAEGRFGIDSGDFLRLAGPRTAQALGRPWNEIARLLAVDPQGDVAKAVASHDTWSGIVLDWPVDGTDEVFTVELSGLPVFDRNRVFIGYRGFGVCRDARKISLAHALRATPSPPASAETAERRTGGEKPVLSIVPPVRNVVPFPSHSPAEKPPSLSPVERSAFQELAHQLSSRLKRNNKNEETPEPASTQKPDMPAAAAEQADPETAIGFVPRRDMPSPASRAASADAATQQERAILERIPLGILVYRIDTPLYANPAFLAWSGYSSTAELAAAGGLDVLTVEPSSERPAGMPAGGQSLTVKSDRGAQAPAAAQLFTIAWDGDTAHALMLAAAAPAPVATSDRAIAEALQRAQDELDELRIILDSTSVGVLVLDRAGRVLSANPHAGALFAAEPGKLEGVHVAELLAVESQPEALGYLEALAREETDLPARGREVLGRTRQGETLPLYLSLGRIGGGQKFCAVLRDLREFKQAEDELLKAKRQAEKAAAAKSEFLAKISHEIRTPLNSIIGFAEVMMSERFGPIANERYLTYLKDIHESGINLVALLNDLLDLSKIEAGKLELNFASVNLNELIQQCVALMQPRATKEKIIVRTSLPPGLPPVMADMRSLRQVVLNLISNSIKFTGAGGQVIISSAVSDGGEVVLRVRDTGPGMSDKEIEMALEPFHQLATSTRGGSGATALGLPLSKALAEANRASFVIRSAVNAGTLVEVAFPPSRVLAA